MAAWIMGAGILAVSRKTMDNTRIEFLNETLKARPDEPFLHYALALELARSGRSEEAWTHFEILLNEHPQYLATYYQAGIWLARLGRIEQARRTLARGVEVARQQGNAHAVGELEVALKDQGAEPT